MNQKSGSSPNQGSTNKKQTKNLQKKTGINKQTKKLQQNNNNTVLSRKLTYPTKREEEFLIFPNCLCIPDMLVTKLLA